MTGDAYQKVLPEERHVISDYKKDTAPRGLTTLNGLTTHLSSEPIA
jgi:hypothetical protein